MRQLKLFIILQAVCCHIVVCQETPAPQLSESSIREEAVYKINRFQIAVIKAVQHCPPLDMNGTNNLFTKESRIQVTTLKTRTKKSYSPLGYFLNLNSLRCGTNSLYDSILVDYLPVSPSEAIIAEFNNSYRVTYKITQTFRGHFRKKQGTYCDITVKEITMVFWKNKGVTEGKIINITAEQPTNCNDKPTTPHRK